MNLYSTNETRMQDKKKSATTLNSVLNQLNIKYLSCEDDLKLGKHIDELAAVDFFMITKEKKLIPYAARISNSKYHPIFSLRVSRSTGTPTEFDKLKKALNTNFLHPKKYMQIYVNDAGELTQLGIIDIKELIELMENTTTEGGKKEFVMNNEGNSTSTFWCLTFDWLEKHSTTFKRLVVNE